VTDRNFGGSLFTGLCSVVLSYLHYSEIIFGGVPFCNVLYSDAIISVMPVCTIDTNIVSIGN
jgi:hypothetical protein